MTYVTSKCPHCKKNIRTFESKSNYAYGSPLQTCPYCSKGYIDNFYIEIAIEGVNFIDEQKIAPGNYIAIILGLLFGLSGVFSLYNNPKDAASGWFLILLGAFTSGCFIYMAISEFKNHDIKMQEIEIEKIASEARMSNKDYVQILQKSGYVIPYKYIEALQDADKLETKI